jgi:hypothetical protein
VQDPVELLTEINPNKRPRVPGGNLSPQRKVKAEIDPHSQDAVPTSYRVKEREEEGVRKYFGKSRSQY